MKTSDRPTRIILAVLDEIEGVSADADKIIRELVDHNETGVALDVLCSLVFEYDVELSLEQKTWLKEAACSMEIPLSQLDGLQN